MPTSAPQLLRRLKITPNYQGYPFLVTAVDAVVLDENLLQDVTKVLYPMVAEAHQTNWKRVEFDMRRAITVCWTRGGREVFLQIAGVEYTKKPTTVQFIDALANYIMRHGNG